MPTDRERLMADIGVEVDIIERRKELERRRTEFDEYNTRMDIKRFNETERQRAAADAAPVAQEAPSILPPIGSEKEKVFLSFDETKLAQTINPELMEVRRAQNLQLSQSTAQIAEESSSTDIELPDVEKKYDTLEERLEQLQNQCMMEKEDKTYETEQMQRRILKEKHIEEKKAKRYRKCYELYEELLSQVIGVDQSEREFSRYEVIKEELMEDIYRVSYGESYKRYHATVLEGLEEGRVLVPKDTMLENEDEVYHEEKKESTQLEWPVLPALQFPVNYNDRANVSVGLLVSHGTLSAEELSALSGHRTVFLRVKDDYAPFKEYFGQLMEKIKTLEKDKKVASAKVAVFDSKMIYPVADADKFLKSATNEQIIAARVNYLVQRQKGETMKLAGVELVPVDEEAFMRWEKEEEDIARKVEDEKDIKNPKSEQKAQREKEPLEEPEEITEFPLPYTAYLNNIYIVVEDFRQNKQITDMEQVFAFLLGGDAKERLEQTVKAKYATIYASAFAKVFYVSNPVRPVKLIDTATLTEKGKSQDKKKDDEAETDPNIAIADEIIKGLGLPEFNIKQYSYQILEDENVQTIKELYKEEGDVVSIIDNDAAREKRFNMEVSNNHKKVINDIYGEMLHICGVSGEQVDAKDLIRYALSPREISGFIESVQKFMRGMIKPLLFAHALKINNYSRLLALRSLKYRSSGIEHLIKELKILRRQMEDVLTEEQRVGPGRVEARVEAVYSEAHQTELENLTHEYRENNETGQANLEHFYQEFMSVQKHIELLEQMDAMRVEREIGWLYGRLSRYYTKEQIDIILQEEEGGCNYQKQLNREIIRLYIEMLNLELLPGEVCRELREGLIDECASGSKGECQSTGEEQVEANIAAPEDKEPEATAPLKELVEDCSDNQRAQSPAVPPHHSIQLIEENREVDFEDISTVLNGIIEYKNQFSDSNCLVDYEREFRQIGQQLSAQYGNSTARLRELLSTSYRLILRAVNYKSGPILLDSLDKYQELLSNELTMVREAYDYTHAELGLPEGDAEQYRPLGALVNLGAVLDFPVETRDECVRLLDAVVSNGVMKQDDRALVMEKMALNEGETVRLLEQSFCLRFLQVVEEPDTSKGAKKGAVVRSERQLHYYYDGIAKCVEALRERVMEVDLDVLSRVVCKCIRQERAAEQDVGQQLEEKSNASEGNLKGDKKELEAEKLREEELRAAEEERIVRLGDVPLFRAIADGIYTARNELVHGHSAEFVDLFINDFLGLAAELTCMQRDRNGFAVFAVALLLLFEDENDYIAKVDKLLGMERSEPIDVAMQAIDIYEYLMYLRGKKFVCCEWALQPSAALFRVAFDAACFSSIQAPQEINEQPSDEPPKTKGKQAPGGRASGKK